MLCEGEYMLEISFNRIKNCISELESSKRECEKIRNELENVYRNFDSLVDGKMDKKALRAVIDEVSVEVENISDMKNVLEKVLRRYERAEQKIVQTAITNKGMKGFSYIPLHAVGNKMQTMGIFFE